MARTPEFEGGPPPKRHKANADTIDSATSCNVPKFNGIGKGLNRPISPPLSRGKYNAKVTASVPPWSFGALPEQKCTTPSSFSNPDIEKLVATETDGDTDIRFICSPVQLTRIKDLAPHENVDTVGLKDILGNPMIKECWNFNFLFDLDFVMEQFDRDIRNMIKLKIVHGFWKKDDERRMHLVETAKRYPGIELLSAYIPDPFGTHHSKMLILFRHDDLAQIVIHTANMIARDWGNMTQAIWTSPLLPLLPPISSSNSLGNHSDSARHPIGTGLRFKVDLIQYIDAYERRLSCLSSELAKYDFSSIQAAFIGSAPSRQKLSTINAMTSTSFGWVGLQEILSNIPASRSNVPGATPHIIMQISSIATSTPAWHSHFQSILSHHGASQNYATTKAPSSSSGFFGKFEPNNLTSSIKPSRPKFNVIFPTPDEIRGSLDGYNSGDSIHMKLESTQQQKQVEYLQPLLCHWNDTAFTSPDNPSREAHRGQAAPHIKTYIRFHDEQHEKIDWAMVTSANLSTQAWGGLSNKKGEVWIQSWETGVVLWPALFNKTTEPSVNEGENTVMVPVFGKDMPENDMSLREKLPEQMSRDGENKAHRRIVVGFRMSYNLPLRSYAATDKPWCASSSYEETDWKGQSWRGYQPH